MAEQEPHGEEREQTQGQTPAPDAKPTGNPQAVDNSDGLLLCADTIARAVTRSNDFLMFEVQKPEGTLTEEELDRVMKMPISKVAELPQQQQDQVWAAIGRQLAQTEQFYELYVAVTSWDERAEQKLERLQAQAEKAGGEILAAFDKIKEMAQAVKPTVERLKSAIESISISPASELLKEAEARLEENLKIWRKLKPYIEAETLEHPEIYGKDATKPASLDELMAAAARRARADGQDIPPLRAEQPRQLEMDLPAIPAGEQIAPAEQTPADIIDRIKKLPILRPAAHVMPNNPLMNILQSSGTINGGEFNLIVAPEKGRRKEITAFVIADYDPGDTGITITDPKITEYERQVSNAIISLWTEAEKQGVEPVFTTDSIYRAMPGGGDSASPQQRGAIARAIEKFRRIHMTIDATEELRKRGVIGENETFRMDEYYFQMTRAKRTSKHGGQPVTAYRLTEMPVILKYAQMTKQILSVPARHLQIRKVKGGKPTTELITMNTERTALTGYMLRRIAIMKHDLEAARDRMKQYERRRKKEPELQLPQKPLEAFRQQSNTILFDTMFAETGTATEDRKQTMLYRNFCLEVLEYWKSTGFISDYATKNSGRKITGIIITL